MPKIPVMLNPTKPKYIEKQVQILDPLPSRWVQAKVLGTLAVHVSVRPEHLPNGPYAITHLPTGRAAAFLATEADALRIMDYLWAKCILAFKEQTLEGVRENLPEWAKSWCIACRAVNKWVDPEPFRNSIR